MHWIPGNHRQYIFSFLIFSLIICSLINPSDSVAENHSNATQHFIWAVEGRKNTVYLMGSIHMLRQSSYPLPQAIEEAYNCCRRVVFETNITSAGSSYFQKKRNKYGLYPKGQTLSQNISPQTLALLQEKLKAAGLTPDRVKHYKPWFVAQLITAMEITKLGYDPNLGIDGHFFRKANKDKKSLVFLETNDFQLALMSSLGEKDQDLFLKGVLTDLDSLESMADDMLDAWERGDAEKLSSIIEKSFAGQADNYDRLIVKRNKMWASKINNFLRQNSDILVIVGSAHLVGKKSVIELLKEQGYNVKQQ